MCEGLVAWRKAWDSLIGSVARLYEVSQRTRPGVSVITVQDRGHGAFTDVGEMGCWVKEEIRHGLEQALA